MFCLNLFNNSNRNIETFGLLVLYFAQQEEENFQFIGQSFFVNMNMCFLFFCVGTCKDVSRLDIRVKQQKVKQKRGLGGL